MTREEELNQASEDYRNFRESCGVNNPVELNEIEDAYYQGIKWADEHPRKGLVDIDEVCKWLGKHFYDSKYEFRDDDGSWIDVDLVLEDLEEAMNKSIYELSYDTRR